VIRVYGKLATVIEVHEHKGGSQFGTRNAALRAFEKLLEEAKQSVALKAAPGIGGSGRF
jgi:hypothetical protein